MFVLGRTDVGISQEPKPYAKQNQTHFEAKACSLFWLQKYSFVVKASCKTPHSKPNIENKLYYQKSNQENNLKLLKPWKFYYEKSPRSSKIRAKLTEIWVFKGSRVAKMLKSSGHPVANTMRLKKISLLTKTSLI